MTDTNSKIQRLIEGNQKFAETYEAPPTMEQMRAAQSKTGGGTVVRTSTAYLLHPPPTPP